MAVAAPVVWHGTKAEWAYLLAAIQHADDDCACNPVAKCPAHQMLLDQATLNRLLFVRRISMRLWAEEQYVKPAD